MLLHRDVDVAEILLRQRLHRTLLLHLGNGRIQPLFQFPLVFAQTEGDAGTEDFLVLYRVADKGEALAVWVCQEAALPSRCHDQRSVEATGGQIQIDLVLILISDDLHALRRQ
ncbi:Uncharacterised protein [Serratia odorifera]|uniref:Uncharacterized protein n=1 Tax=Serratia odorifera TaxID=618 RepID=A0A3S4HWE4_SEROD|nr:Uncharacterised protein [Serratia odorifera]